MKVTTSLVIAAAVLCAAQQVHAIDFTPSSVGGTGADALSTEDSPAQEELQTGSFPDVTSDVAAEKGTSPDDLTGDGADTLSSDSSQAGDDLATETHQDISDATDAASCSEEFSLAGSAEYVSEDELDFSEELDIADSDCSEELDIADSDFSEELDIADSDCSEELDIAGSDCSEELDIADSECSEELDLAGLDMDEPVEGKGDAAVETPGAEKSDLGETPEADKSDFGTTPVAEKSDHGETPEAEKSDLGETPGAEKSDLGETPVAQKSDLGETPGAEKSDLGETPLESVDPGEPILKSSEPEDEVTASKDTEGGGGLTEDTGTETGDSATKTSEADKNPFALLDNGGSAPAPAPAVEHDTPLKPETEEPTLPSELDEGKETSTATKGTEESLPDVEDVDADTTPTGTFSDTTTKGEPPLETGGQNSAETIHPDAPSSSIPGLPTDTSTDLSTDLPTDLTTDTGTDGNDAADSDCSEELDIAGSDCSEELDIADSDCSEELDIADSDCSEELDIAGSDCSEELDIAGQDDSYSQEFSIAGIVDSDELDLGGEMSITPGAEKGDAVDTETYNSDMSAPSSEENPADILQESSGPASVPSTATTPTSGSKDSLETAKQTAFSAEAVNFKSGGEPASTSMNLTPFIAAGVACVMLAIVGAVYMKRRSSRSKKAAGDIFTIDKNSAL